MLGGSQSPDRSEGQAEGVSPPALQRPENLCCAGGSQSPDSSEGPAEGGETARLLETI
jgi:hypothetical protein